MKKLVLGAVVAVLHVVGFADGLSEGFESYAVGDSITNVTGFVCTDGEAAQVAAYDGEYTAYSGERAEPFAGQANTRYLEVDTDMTAPVLWDLSTFGEPDTSRVIDMTTRFVTLDDPEDAEDCKIALWADGAGRICAMAASPLTNMAVSNAAYVSSFATSDFKGMHRVVMNFQPSANGRMSVMQVSVDGQVLTFDGAATAMQGLKSTGWWDNASYPFNVVAAIAQGRVLPCLDAGSVGCNTVRSVGVVGSGAVDDLYVTCPKTGLEGSGTPADPYKVGTATDLKLMRDLLNAGKLSRSAYFALTSDIDMPGEDAWAGIGCSTNMFSGHFDGCNCMISGLKLYASRTNGSEFGGLFSVVSNAVIENVYLENVSTDCPDYFGAAVAGKVYGGTFRNVTATGSLSGTYNLGGIACWATAGGDVLFEACTNCVAVATSYTKAGGFLAYADHACGNIRFDGCWNAAAIRAETDAGKGLSAVGGFIGRVDGSGSFIEAYDLRNIGEVSAAMSGTSEYATTVCAGGFIGQANLYSGILVDGFFNRKSVGSCGLADEATVCAGGIVGQMGNSPVLISQSIVEDAVTANVEGLSQVYCGAFVGYNTAYDANGELGLQLVESRCLKDAVPFGRDVAVGGYNAVEIEDDTFARYFYQTEFDVEDNGVVMHFSVTNGMARLAGTDWMSDPVELVTIPSVVGGEPVVEICDWALCGSTIANIVVPASVRSIGTMAFGFNWELESIRFLGAEPLAGDAIFSNTPPTVVSYFIPTNDGWRVSSTNEAFISEWPRVGECRPLLQWDGETPGEYIRVTFDPGEYGYLQGYGIKYAVEGGNVVPPSVRPKAGWFFTGWDKELTGITEEMTVTAQYRTSKADLHVDAVEIPESATTGDKVTIRWTVGNTGNPNWTGKVVEEIRLVDASNNANTVTVARVTETISVVRDGQTDREYAWEIPLKGLAGEWKVVVETSIGNSGEFGGDNTGISAGTLKITQCPLPDLKIGSVALDRSPANYQPEDTVTVTYVEQNVGTAAAGARAVSLFAVKGETRIRLATESVQAELAASGEREGTIQAVIPQLIQISGDVNFVVTPNANGDIVELTDAGADADSGKTTATIARRLYLAPNADFVRENASSMRYYARRSGETDSAVTLAITASGSTDDVTFPETVKINRGSQTATFYVYPKDNALVDGSRFVDIQLAGDGYVAATHTLEIRDNEVPKLFITMDKTTVREGEEAIKVTITRELVTDEPLTVYLSGLSTSQCSYPTEIKIPAGEASYTFEIEAVNNDTAEIAAASTLRASATGYTAATQGITIEDDDVPSVTLTIYPEEVSEGAGANAAYAILSRVDEHDKIDQAIRVNLSVSEPNQLIVQSSVTIPARTLAVRFPIGTVDNGADDGDREVKITGSIYISSCGCSGQPSSGDIIEATIRIIDNDVPSLKLVADPSTMREGLAHAGDLILSHNSILAEDLEVQLSYDTEGEIDIPESVIIPAGQTQVIVPVRTIDDGETDGGKLVSVYADDGSGVFASASTWIQVSDQNLPDIKVESISLPGSVYAGKVFDVEFDISNIGFVDAKSDVEYTIHLLGGTNGNDPTSANKVGSGKISGGLAVGESQTIMFTATAPTATGDYRIAIVTDPNGRISELDDANDSLVSEVIAVSAAYAATVTVERKTYMPTEQIVFSGVATLPDGTTPAANLPIDLYVLVSGMRRTFNLTTGADGTFAMTFTPTSGEAGRYTIGACYPGMKSTVVQDYFDILGMKRTSTSNVIWDIALGDTVSRTVYIQNRSMTPLTGIALELTGVPSDCQLDYTLPNTIPAGGTISLVLTATAIDLTPQTDYEKMYLRIASNEGPELEFPAFFHSQSQKGQLKLSPTSINTTMAVGHVRYIDVTLMNDGKGDSGKVTLSIPSVSWLRIVSGATIDNLASGESAVITLEVAPEESDNLVLNNPQKGGRLAANCVNGSSASVSLTFTPVSEATGSVTVDALDNNTYVLESAPHLAGATVRITNPYTGALVASGTTGADGLWHGVGIAEGRYQLQITAPNHDSYAQELVIEPGADTKIEAFLQYQIVTATWNVEKTEIEDNYEVTLLLDFETSVPAPVVNTIMPTDFPTLNEGESWSFTVKLENTGVIAAERVTVVMPTIEGYEFTLSDNDVAVPAKSTVEISGVFSRPRKQLQGRQKLEATVVTVVTVACTYRARTIVVYPCGKEHPEYAYEKVIRHGECESSVVTYIIDDNWNGGNGGGGGSWDPRRDPGTGGNTGTGGFYTGTGSTYQKKNCNTCYMALRDALDSCNTAINAGIDAGSDYLGRLGNPNITRVPFDFLGSFGETAIIPPMEDLKLGRPMKDVYRDEENADNPSDGGDYARIDKTGIQDKKLDEKTYPPARVDETGCLVAEDGFKAALYTPKGYNPKDGDPDEIVVAFAGTDGPTNEADMKTNIKNGSCFKTEQYERAASYLKAVKEAYPNAKITVTGHSLGGGLAEYAVVKNNYGGQVSAVTYNSAGICPALLPENIDYDAAGKSIRNYRTVDDYVSVINAHVGEIKNIIGIGHDVLDKSKFKYFDPERENVTGSWGELGLTTLRIAAASITRYVVGIGSELVDVGASIGGSLGSVMGGVESCLAGIFKACEGTGFRDYWNAYSELRDEGILDATFDTGNAVADKGMKDLATLALAYGAYKRGVNAIFKGNEAGNAAQQETANAFGAKSTKAVLKSVSLASSGDQPVPGSNPDEWFEATPAELSSILNQIMIASIDDPDFTVEDVIEAKPSCVSEETLEEFIRRLKLFDACVKNQDADGAKAIMDLESIGKDLEIAYRANAYAVAHGHANAGDMWESAVAEIRKAIDAEADSVCASVTLKLSQSVSMTREAFNGTLTMYNGNTQTPITDLKMEVSITDEEGNECKGLFVATDKGNAGDMTGGYILDGGLSVKAGGTGSAVIQFIPERAAADPDPKLYKFGGTITYTDPFSGEKATIKLTPVALTVNPSPYLKLHYFVQRDVYGDDPKTETVEASMPAEMAVLVVNEGSGEAKNVTISSVQPEIVKNEKGLAAEFSMKNYSLDRMAVNGATAHLGLNTVSLGSIPAGESEVAQWWLTSSIDGHFTKMAATVTPVNSWNTPDTMLVNPKIDTHALIRSLSVQGETMPYFLVSDAADLYGEPDVIYGPTGESADVLNDAAVAVEGALIGAAPELTVTVTPSAAGWNYVSAPVAGAFRYTIVSVRRNDGTVIPVRNAWITNKIFRDGLDPLLEERIHIADNLPNNAETTYSILLAAKPTDVVEVESFAEEDNAVEYLPRDSVTVNFSAIIDPSTFTVDDLILRKQGVKIDDLSSVKIEAADSSGKSFTISGLADLCGDLARYELVVQCAGIADVSGQLGIAGRAIAWSLATPDSPYIINAEGIPVVRVKMFDGFTTVMSVPVTADSASRMVIRLNGVDVSDKVTVVPSDSTGTRFDIQGLDVLQTQDGEYVLEVEGGNLRGTVGGEGIDTFTTKWVRDTIAPKLTSVERTVGLGGQTFTVALSEEVVPTTISLENVKLTWTAPAAQAPAKNTLKATGGVAVELPPSTRMVALGDGVYSVTGFDSATLVDGTYTLSFDAEGVADEAGNEASGVKSVSWTVDTTPPSAVQNLSTSSEYGSVETCVYTTSRNLTISGTVPEANVTVQILAKFVGGSEVLLVEPELDANLSFSEQVELPGDGSMTIIVRLTDAEGNSSDNEFSVYVDIIALEATLSGVPAAGEPADTLTLTFNAEPEEATVLAAAKTLTFNGGAVEIPNVAIAKVDDKTYSITGLDEYTAGYGAYAFTFDATTVKKALSGKTGSATASLTWDCIQQDKTPPQIAEVLFGGETPVAAYADHEMFSQISVRFTEAVNVPALIESELIGSALRIELLDEGNAITGIIKAENVSWNEQTFTAAWAIDQTLVPCGKARLVVDSSLVEDMSGNKLAVSDGFDVISGHKTYTPSLFKSGVANAYACPSLTDWNSDGLLDLVVGEETTDMKGKVRIYLNRGTKENPVYDDYTYLKIGDDDVEFEAQGCVGMQVSFGRVRGASMVLAASNGEIYGWRHRVKNPKTKEPYPMELIFDHKTDARFVSLIRAQTFCCDIDGDGLDEIVVSGQNSPMFWIKRIGLGEETRVECTPLMDPHGEYLVFPEGQNHTSAVLLDVNGDTIPDLVTGDTTGNVWVYLGTENGRFAATPTRIYENAETSNTRSRLAVGDIDGDGVEDILVGRKDGSILKLKGEAMLAPAVSFKRVELKSVEQALSEDLFWVDGADGWVCQQSGESAQAFATHTTDGETTLLMARFVGKGTVTFTWSVSDAGENSVFKCAGGDSPIEKSGTFTSVAQSIVISTEGNHQFVWTFTGKGKAVISDVAFAPASPEAQVTQTSVVPIKFADIRRFANAVWKDKGGDYEAAVTSIAANGKTVEENCIAGVDSSDPDAAFRTAIEVVNGVPKVSPDPDLGDERVYTFWGRESLETGDWKVITEEEVPLMRFFKVDVRMP